MEWSMNEIINFNFESKEIRTVVIDGNPWWVAKDICSILDIQNTTQAIQGLEIEERAMFNIGRQGETNIINESGLYTLVLQSRKPESKKFRKWITSEVIPNIRKTGKYVLSPEVNKKEIVLQAINILQDEIKELQSEKKQLTGTIDRLTHTGKTYTSTELAKELNMKSAQELNGLLQDLGVQFKVNGSWCLYSRYADKGYISLKQSYLDNGTVIYERHWTGEGRKFVLDLFNTSVEVIG